MIGYIYWLLCLFQDDYESDDLYAKCPQCEEEDAGLVWGEEEE